MASKLNVDADIQALEIMNEEVHRLRSRVNELSKKRFFYVLKKINFNTITRKIRMRDYREKNPENFRIDAQKKLMHKGTKRTVIYTCITGDYDVPQTPLYRAKNIDYVLFSDNPEAIKSSVWDVRDIPKYVMDKFGPSSQNRYVKMHPSELFGDTYDYSIYVDGNIQVISDISVYSECVSPEVGIALHKHRSRDCAYDEAKICKKLRKGNLTFIDRFIQMVSLEDFPHQYGLAECNMIVVNLRNPVGKSLMEMWWGELFHSKVGRDQLIFPYVVWRQGLRMDSITTLGANIYQDMKVLVESHKE